MASAMSLFFVQRPGILSRRSCGLHFHLRHTHSQSLWEELLGRKIEPSAAKRLEEAFLEYRVRKAVPSWLPFFPNCSFWIPSSEETIKNLQVLAERIRVSKPASQERPAGSKSSTDSSETGLSKVAQWAIIQQTDRLLSREVALQSSGSKVPAERGSLIEVHVVDEDDDDSDDSSEEELEADENKKPKGVSD